MTIGELANYFNEEFRIRADLKVIRMKNWQREMYYDETSLIWVSPSPNMPTLNTALVYPGTCLVEGTNISEGRGTVKPFEMIGAPWIYILIVLSGDSHRLRTPVFSLICFVEQIKLGKV